MAKRLKEQRRSNFGSNTSGNRHIHRLRWIFLDHRRTLLTRTILRENGPLRLHRNFRLLLILFGLLRLLIVICGFEKRGDGANDERDWSNVDFVSPSAGNSILRLDWLFAYFSHGRLLNRFQLTVTPYRFSFFAPASSLARFFYFIVFSFPPDRAFSPPSDIFLLVPPSVMTFSVMSIRFTMD